METLKKLIYKNKRILFEKDDLERSLLYLAARNGFFNICEFLLKNGMNINEPQKDGSTPLHGAVFYNQDIIVQLLLEYGEKTNIKNKFNALPSDDACSISIKNNILNSQTYQISILSSYLINKKLAKKLILVKYNNKIIGKKIMRSENMLPSNINYIKNNWEPTFHGTKFNSLESIMKYGLLPSGTKLGNGVELKPPSGHIPLNVEVAGYKNWSKAIFVSPSILYAGHPCYSERINVNNERYSVLIESRVKPNSFTSHNSTVLQYVHVDGELVKLNIELKLKMILI